TLLSPLFPYTTLFRSRGTFRVRGDILEIYPTYEDQAYRIEMWGDQIDALRQIDPLTGEVRPGQQDLSRVPIYPKTHYAMPQDQRSEEHTSELQSRSDL